MTRARPKAQTPSVGGGLGQETPLWLIIAFVIAVALIAFYAFRSWRALRGSGAWSDEPSRPSESESPFWVPREIDRDRDKPGERDR